MIQLPQEDWMELRLMDTKVGYAHTYMENSTYGNEDAIKIRAEMVMEIRRLGGALKLNRTKESYLTTDLKPLYFVYNSNETGQDKLVEGRVDGNALHVKTTLSGDTTESIKPFPEGIIFEEMLSYIAFQRGLKVGDEYTVDVFNVEFLKPVTTTVEVLREDILAHEGKSVSVRVLEHNMDVMGGMQVNEWLGLDGTTYRTEMGTMGLKMELIKADMETALGEVGEVDVIISTKLFLKGTPPMPGCDNFKARVQLSEGNISETIMSTERQNISPDADMLSGILEVHTLNIDEQSVCALKSQVNLKQGEACFMVGSPSASPIRSKQINDDFVLSGREGQALSPGVHPLKTNDELAKFLQSTVYVQANDASIKEKASEIIGDETNSWRAAKIICKWVYESISNKSLKVGFGSAKQTLETLEGDCTEHTVLFIALARAAGIPSRICSGIVYHRDAFYYHFWPEVYIGKWIEMEPTLGQFQADAAHIKLTGGMLESEFPLEFGEGVLRTLNQLQIERIE